MFTGERIKVITPHIAVVFFFIVYCVLGAVVFRHIEDPSLNSTDWELNSALLFSFSIITTVGYGHVSPSTDAGKIVCILYAFIGIPLGLLTLANIGKFCLEFLHKIETFVKKYFHKWKNEKHDQPDEENPMGEPSFITISIFTALVLFTNVFLAIHTNHLPFLDALYFVFITYMTVGFGDIVISTDEILWMVVVMANVTVGLAVMTVFVSILADLLKRLHYFGRKITNLSGMTVWIGGQRISLGEYTQGMLQQAGVDPTVIDQLMNNFDNVVQEAQRPVEETRPQPLTEGLPYGAGLKVPYIDEDTWRLMTPSTITGTRRSTGRSGRKTSRRLIS